MSTQAMSWVFRKSQTKHDTRLVMLALANDINSEGRHAWTSQATLAAEAGEVSDRTVRRVLDAARELGEVDWVETAGRTKAGTPRRLYWFPKMLGDGLAPWDSDTGDRFGLTPDDLSAAESRRHRTNPTPTPDKSDNESAPHKTKLLDLNLKHPNAPDAREAFDRFWSVYPRKDDKGDARKAWAKRIKAGADPEDLIVGAERFGRWCVEALRVGELEAKKFIKLPATWLNKESETNELSSPSPPLRSNGKGKKYDIVDAWDDLERMANERSGVESDLGSDVRRLPGN